MNPLASYGLACLIAAALSAFCTWKIEEWRWTAITEAQKSADSEAARNREKAMTIANQGVDRALQNQKARVAADSGRVADGLRDLQAAIGPLVDTAATGGTDDPRDAIIDQCAFALGAVDGEAKKLAIVATGLQSYAGEVCLAQ